MEKNYKFGIIGCGNMADAILGGAISVGILDCGEVLVYDVTETQSDKFHTKYGVNVAKSIEEVAKNTQYTLLAVKPQNFQAVAPRLDGASFLISIMAGVRLDTILQETANVDKAVRIMPNAPARVGEGMSALVYRGASESDIDFVDSVFSSIGKVIKVTEDKLDAVTAISGSGPAYVYYFIKSMVDAGISLGLSEKESETLTLQTFKGAVKMASISDTGLDKLIDMVCSKGGTTIEAITHFNDTKTSDIIAEAVKKCYNRSVELSGK